MNAETLQHIPWVRLLLGTLAYFLLGAIWYSKLLFSEKWIRYTKVDVNDPNAKKGVGLMFGGSFVLMFLTSFALAVLAWKMQTTGWVNGAKLGLFTGTLFGATAISVSYLYEKRPIGLHCINGGYTILGNMLAGMIICGL